MIRQNAGESQIMSRSKELFRNIIIFGIGTFGAKLVQTLLIPLYTFYMTAEEYSTSDTIVSTIALMSPFLSLGISEVILRFTLNNEENRKSVLKLSLSICAAGTVLLACFVPILDKVSIFCGYGFIMPVLYACSMAKTIVAQYCKAIEKNIVYSIDGILSALSLTLITFVLVAVFHMGIWGYLFATILSQILSILYLSLTCHILQEMKGAVINRKLSREMLAYSVPLTPNQMSWWIIQMSDRYMIIYFCGKALNGLYSMAYKIPAVFNLLVSIFGQAFSISVIKECDRAPKIDGKYDGTYFARIYERYIALTFTTVVLVIFASRFLAAVIMKKEFYDAWVYIPLLLCAYAIGNLQAFYGTLLGGVKQSVVCFLSTFSGAVANVALNLLLIPRYHAFGAAIATIASYMVVYLVRMISIRKYIVMRHYEIRIAVSITIILTVSVLYIQDAQYSGVGCATLVLMLLILYFRDIMWMFSELLNFCRRRIGSAV